MYLVSKLKKYETPLSLEEIFNADDSFEFDTGSRKSTISTRTTIVDALPPKYYSKFRLSTALATLKKFNEDTKDLHVDDMSTLYHSFTIPKRSGGRRNIDAPNDDLSKALRELKAIFEQFMPLNFHASAYAYIKGRSAVDVARKHQERENRWFLKMDFSNFFGSTTKEFVMSQLSKVYPFALICELPEGKEELSKALDLCFLNGGLPQGTPISPLLTNIIMIPIDHDICNHPKLVNDFTYTRYADDTIIGSKYAFADKIHEIQTIINDVLKKHGAPYRANSKKTKYGSSAGRNYILGVILNKDNKISVGAERRKNFKTAIYTMLADFKDGTRWDVERVQELQGLCAYFSMVNADDTANILAHYGKKTGLDAKAVFKELLRV